jgi:hypothetical protein
VEGDVPVDNDTLLVTDFVNLKIKLAQFLVTDFMNIKIKLTQSVGGTHKNRMYVCIFIEVSSLYYISKKN